MRPGPSPKLSRRRSSSSRPIGSSAASRGVRPPRAGTWSSSQRRSCSAAISSRRSAISGSSSRFGAGRCPRRGEPPWLRRARGCRGRSVRAPGINERTSPIDLVGTTVGVDRTVEFVAGDRERQDDRLLLVAAVADQHVACRRLRSSAGARRARAVPLRGRGDSTRARGTPAARRRCSPSVAARSSAR